MPAPSDPADPVAQPTRLPVVLNLNLLAAAAAELPVLTIPCSIPGALPAGEPHGPLSWQELLGER